MNYSLSVRPDKLEFPSAKQTVEVTVTTDGPYWEYTNNISWLEIERTETGFSATAKAYSGDEARTGALTVYVISESGDIAAKQNIPVSQASPSETPDGMVVFDDSTFKNFMLSYYDQDYDGAISPEEALRVTELSLGFDEEDEEAVPITSLKGIEYCKNLINLECDFNAITSLDLSGLDKLEYVDCSYNLIKTVNLSGCTSLKQFYGNMNEIGILDFQECPNLQLIQAYKNKLTSCDVGEMSNLVYLDVSQNQLTTLNISNCSEMLIVNCGSNKLAALDLSGLEKLTSLGCYNNNLTTLDTSKLPELSFLECYANSLTTLDLTTNSKIATLHCQNNLLETLKIETCKNLTSINCSQNSLEGELDLSGRTELRKIDCGNTFLTKLNLTDCAKS